MDIHILSCSQYCLKKKSSLFKFMLHIFPFFKRNMSKKLKSVAVANKVLTHVHLVKEVVQSVWNCFFSGCNMSLEVFLVCYLITHYTWKCNIFLKVMYVFQWLIWINTWREIYNIFCWNFYVSVECAEQNILSFTLSDSDSMTLSL